MVICSKCGKKNQEKAEYCTSCGASLFTHQRKNHHEDTCFGEEKDDKDYLGLISFGTFLIIIGIVITANSNVFSVFFSWIKQLATEKIWIRPSDEFITSITLFFGLSGISNFFIAALRFITKRNRRRVLTEILSGFALLFFAYLLNLYNNYVLRLRMVLAIEIVICGLLIIMYSISRYILHSHHE